MVSEALRSWGIFPVTEPFIWIFLITYTLWLGFETLNERFPRPLFPLSGRLDIARPSKLPHFNYGRTIYANHMGHAPVIWSLCATLPPPNRHISKKKESYAHLSSSIGWKMVPCSSICGGDRILINRQWSALSYYVPHPAFNIVIVSVKCEGITRGLGFLHKHDIVHRDLKCV